MAGLESLEGKVAVVTGGAGGIGRGIAEELLSRGAKVVIADIDAAALERTASEIGAVGVRTDVSKLGDLQALADQALREFGRVDILCNNAGIGPFARIEDMSLDDWTFMLNVNLWSVIYGVHVFLPHILGNADGGHIVNTASMAGLISPPTVGGYAVSKAGVIAHSEALAAELANDHPKVGVGILCPGPVSTNITTSQRNRPASLKVGGLRDISVDEQTGGDASLVRMMRPREVGSLVADSIQDGRLYIITHPEMFGSIRDRHKRIAAAYGEWPAR